MKTVVMIGANNLYQYNWPSLLEKNINIVILSGEYTKEKNKNLINNYNLNHKIIPTIPFPDPDVELFDEHSIYPACKKLLEDNSDLILYTDDEKYMIQVSIVRDMLNISGPRLDNVLKFRDKMLMREELSGSGMNLTKFIKLNRNNLPEYQSLKSYFEGCKFVIKPTLLAGSFGFYAVASEEQYVNAIKELGNLPEDLPIMAEAFMPGELFHFDGIINNGELVLDLLCRYAYPNSDFKDGKLLSSIPIFKNNALYYRIYEYCIKVLEVLEPSDGGIHLELFYEEERDIISFLEIGNRPPGSHINTLYVLNYDFNIHQYSLLSAIGLLSSNKINKVQENVDTKTSMYTFNGYIPKMDGCFDFLQIPPLNGHISIRPFHKYQDKLSNPLSIGDTVAYFEVINKRYKESEIDFNIMKSNRLFSLFRGLEK